MKMLSTMRSGRLAGILGLFLLLCPGSGRAVNAGGEETGQDATARGIEAEKEPAVEGAPLSAEGDAVPGVWEAETVPLPSSETPEQAGDVNAANGEGEAAPGPGPSPVLERPAAGTLPQSTVQRRDGPPAPAGMTSRALDIWRTARLLDIPFPLLRDGVEALEALYARRYDEARNLFQSIADAYPDQAVGPFGMAVLAQAKMAENLDYSEDDAYRRAFDTVMARIDSALEQGRSPAWNYFMRGTVLGMNSFYEYRQDKVLSAIKDGWVAISDMERAREIEPDFVDPLLGLGLYNYWRSVVTVWFKNLPFFPDRRKEGLEQMAYVRDHGVFAPPLARLSLAFSYYENRRFDDALRESLALYDAYPDNIINLQILGRLYMRKHKNRLAEKTLLRVLEIDPTNVQVHYALGYLYFYHLRDLNKARASLAVVADRKPGTYYGEVSRVRLGDVCWLLDEHDEALALWRQAYEAMPGLKAAEIRVKKDWRPPDRPWRKQIAAARRRKSASTPPAGPADSSAPPASGPSAGVER